MPPVPEHGRESVGEGMKTTETYRCTGCGKGIRSPEGLCASCFKDLREFLAEEKKARKMRRKKKTR